MKRPEWLNSLIKSWHQEQAVVISLNYDTLIERAARELEITDRIGRILSDQMYPPYFAMWDTIRDGKVGQRAA